MSIDYDQAISNLLKIFNALSCNNNQQIQIAEKELQHFSRDMFYPLYLLRLILINDQSVNDFNKTRAAIEFKKWAINDWTKPNLQDIEFSELHIEIKKVIIKVYLQANPKDASLLLEAILSIAKYEFHFRWESLVQDLLSNLDLNNLGNYVNLRVFKLLAKIMSKYEFTSRSDALSLEILFLSSTMANAFFEFTKRIIGIFLEGFPNDVNYSKDLLDILKQTIRCFYFINCHDIPPEIEDNLGNWMTCLKAVLGLNIGNDPNLKMKIYKCKGESLRSVILYFTRYREDIESLVLDFSGEIYNACLSLTDEDCNNKFVLNSMKYFKNLLYWEEVKQFFTNSIESIIGTIILRMEKPTKDDVEVYETEPEGFLENVFNNAGGSSRKNICHDLAKALAKRFNNECVPILQNLVAEYVKAFQNGQGDQLNEITLMSLLIDMGVGAYTPKFGVTEIQIASDFFTYYYESIIEPTLNQLFQTVTSDANFEIESINLFYISHLLRFPFFFRNYLPRDKVHDLIKNCSYLLRTKDPTLKRILYYFIESVILLRENPSPYVQSNYVFNKDNILGTMEHVLQNLYNDIKGSTTLEAFQLRPLLNIIKITDVACAQFIDAFADMFSFMIQKLFQSYDFSTIYVVFENLSTLMVTIKDNDQAIQKLVQTIFPLMNTIIQNNHVDLLSFAFQIYALAIHFYNISSDDPKVIFESLMNVNNWGKDMIPMFPAYIMFVEEFINKDIGFLGQHLESFHKILQVMVEADNEDLFFSLANKIVSGADLQALRDSGLMNTMLNVLFVIFDRSRNTNVNKENNKVGLSTSVTKGVLVFIGLCIVKFSFEEFMNDVGTTFGDNIGLFYQVLIESANFAKHYQKMPERKIIINGLNGLIFSSIYDKLPQEVWVYTLNSVVENIHRRKNHKYGIDPSDGGSKGITTGFSSNFIKLSCFKKSSNAFVPSQYENLPNEDQKFVEEFKNKFSNNASQILENFIDPKMKVLLKNMINIDRMLSKVCFK